MAVYTQPASGRSRLAGASGFLPVDATKADPTGSLIVSSYGLAQPVRTPRRFDKLADEGYNQSPPVFRAINIIASAVAGIPWQLFSRKGAKGVSRPGMLMGRDRKGHTPHGEQIDAHPLLDLMQRPNDTQGWGKFIEAYVSYLYIAGNSYVWANQPPRGGAPAELWTIRPDRMRVVPDEKAFVSGYTYEVNGKSISFDRASVLHTKTFAALDDWYGMSPLVVAARAIDIRNSGGDWNLAMLQNSGRVPGFFVTTEKLGDTQFERMREQLIERYSGARNVGIPGLLEEGLGWVEAGKTPRDMDWLNLSREQGRDIAMTLGVPSELLGDSSNKTFSNYQEARASLYTETVLPLMDMIRDELNRWLTPMYGASAYYLDYDKEDIEALQEERGKLYQWVSKASFLTINEQRDILGYPERPEGDVIVVNLNMAPLDEVVAGTEVRHVLPSAPLGGAPMTPTAAQGRPNDGSASDEGAPTPAPDADGAAPGGAGVSDGGMASGVDAGAKAARAARAPVYDPLDDLLAGKVIHFDPKAASRSTRERQRA